SQIVGGCLTPLDIDGSERRIVGSAHSLLPSDASSWERPDRAWRKERASLKAECMSLSEPYCAPAHAEHSSEVLSEIPSSAKSELWGSSGWPTPFRASR